MTQRRPQPWWSAPGFTQHDWQEIDWRQWEKEGRPEIPRENRLGANDPLPTSGPVIAPLHTVPPGFALTPPKRSSRDARSRGIDKLLDSIGVEPRRRGR